MGAQVSASTRRMSSRPVDAGLTRCNHSRRPQPPHDPSPLRRYPAYKRIATAVRRQGNRSFVSSDIAVRRIVQSGTIPGQRHAEKSAQFVRAFVLDGRCSARASLSVSSAVIAAVYDGRSRAPDDSARRSTRTGAHDHAAWPTDGSMCLRCNGYGNNNVTLEPATCLMIANVKLLCCSRNCCNRISAGGGIRTLMLFRAPAPKAGM